MDVIETTNLTKYYGKHRGIENLNLRVSEGDFFGFIGPNGAGKSTTIRALLGLIHPTSGEAKIFGQEITRYQTEILVDIGYMPSEAIFTAACGCGTFSLFRRKCGGNLVRKKQKSCVKDWHSIRKSAWKNCLSGTGKRCRSSALCNTNRACVSSTNPRAGWTP